MRPDGRDGRPRCHGYVVAVDAGEIVVTCAVHGPCGRFTAAQAVALADALRGPLGRFETGAVREERERLAALLETTATELVGAA